MSKPRVKVKDVNVFRNSMAGSFQFTGTLTSEHPHIPVGENITSSRVQKVDFTTNTIETLNTVYEVEGEIGLYK